MITMIFKTKKIERSVTLTRESQTGIISYCKMNHPNEMVLILKGKFTLYQSSPRSKYLSK